MKRIVSLSGASARKKRRGAPATPPAGSYPAWRAGKTVGQVYSITGTAPNSLKSQLLTNTGAADHDLRDGWIGFTLDEDNSRWLNINSGGSTSACNTNWCNPILQIDFTADAPAWSAIDWGTTSEDDISARRFYLDGRPISRHTYNLSVYFRPGALWDGKERIAHVGGYATLANQAYSGGSGIAVSCGFDHDTEPDIQLNQNAKNTNGFDLCRLNPSDWFAHTGTHQSGLPYDGSVHGWETDLSSTCPATNPSNGQGAGEYFVTIAQDPTSHDLWVGGSGAVGNDALWKYDASTGLWSGNNTTPLMTRATQAEFKGAQGGACMFDRIRNRIVTLYAAQPDSDWRAGQTPRLIFTLPESPYTTTRVNLSNYDTQTGAPEGFVPNEVRLVHDLDNDVYCVYTLSSQVLSQAAGWVRDFPQDNTPILWQINPDTGAMSVRWSGHTAGVGQINAANNHCFSFLPNMNCLVWCDKVNRDIQFMPTA